MILHKQAGMRKKSIRSSGFTVMAHIEFISTTQIHWIPKGQKLAPYSSLFLKFSEAELTQYRSPVGFGPSGKTWPK